MATRTSRTSRKRDKYRMVKILIIGIVLGLTSGMFVMAGMMGQKLNQVKRQYEAANGQKGGDAKKSSDDKASGGAESQTAGGTDGGSAEGGQDESWKLVLVNESHPLDVSYVPELTEVVPDRQVDTRIVGEVNQMLQDAANAGLNLYIVSAYRSYEQQREVFNQTMTDWIGQGKSPLDAYDETKKSVAVPGTSEHATGLVMDITSGEIGELDERQAETAEAQWLAANCAQYGFILRYPPEKSDVTGIIYEPWHYRYVGKEAAQEIMSQGITLEEYLSK